MKDVSIHCKKNALPSMRSMGMMGAITRPHQGRQLPVSINRNFRLIPVLLPRYPCYYAPDNPEFVVSRFNLKQTRWIFFVFFLVPASLLVVSCGVLFTCSRVLNVNNSGHMDMNCCSGGDQTHIVASGSHYAITGNGDAL